MSLAERIRRGRRAIQLAKQDGLETSDWERHLSSLLDTAGRESDRDDSFEPWALWEWRRMSKPRWRQILAESTAEGDIHREKYARWMLWEVLLDPEYEDSNS